MYFEYNMCAFWCISVYMCCTNLKSIKHIHTKIKKEKKTKRTKDENEKLYFYLFTCTWRRQLLYSNNIYELPNYPISNP